MVIQHPCCLHDSILTIAPLGLRALRSQADPADSQGRDRIRKEQDQRDGIQQATDLPSRPHPTTSPPNRIQRDLQQHHMRINSGRWVMRTEHRRKDDRRMGENHRKDEPQEKACKMTSYCGPTGTPP